MALVYDDSAPRKFSGAFNPDKFDATQQWLRHYANLLQLEFFAQRGTRDERAQALREIPVAQRKLTYWKNQSNWSESTAIAGKNAIDRQWKR